ncbi:UAA transporter [Carpediemonas membranifera]|uniref:UAA transporter n=1 Tax=Carpediemonas membranifera TaxID=201153 RepID=A0A8J6AV92_9EUKA|nr:UAA transporter [Carpediemonas membranifera]|eukprot:KAG9395053.1 UAA transporter [Carpediemonas membranifera]
MSHRKFEAPRHGSLGFLPRKRCKHIRGRVRSFPKDMKDAAPHLTGFIGFKAGMTHVVRDSALYKRELTEAATVLDCPPMVVIGITGYTMTPRGLRALTTVWAEHIAEEAIRRQYKNFYNSKKKAFSVHKADYATNEKTRMAELERMKKYCSVVRVIAHTQMSKVPFSQKKAHIMEIQINGGSAAEKVDFGYALFEKEVLASSIFAKDELVDTIGVSKGNGYEGVTTRWGTSRLPRKTRRGLRRVGCIGPWHPANVRYSVARSGQDGFHHRTITGKQIYRLAHGQAANSATTSYDLTDKAITPMGGFPHYGQINNEFLLVKGSVIGTSKRVITLRKAIMPTSRNIEAADLKFIDTSSKLGHGKHQTAEEKARYYNRA